MQYNIILKYFFKTKYSTPTDINSVKKNENKKGINFKFTPSPFLFESISNTRV